MSRTMLAGQEEVFRSSHRREAERVWIANHTGTMVDVTPWVLGWHVDVDVERQAMGATILLARKVDGQSLAPLMSENPAVTIERNVKIEAFQCPIGEEPESGDWHNLFEGQTDDMAWPDAVMSVPCRGPWGRIYDEQITDDSKEYNGPVQTVMQEVNDDWLETDTPTVFTIGDPDRGVENWRPSLGAIEKALTKLRDYNGWDLRYMYHEGSGTWRLTFQEPPTHESPLFTFEPGEYESIPSIELYTSDRRRQVVVLFGEEGRVEVDDETLVAGERLKAMTLNARNDGNISTTAQALALAQAAGRDVFQPPLRKRVRHRFFPWIELWDKYRWTANDVHYSTDQDMVVTGYRHGREPGKQIRTEMSLYQRPVGSIGRWLVKADKDRLREEIVPPEPPEPPPPQDAGLFYTQPAATQGFADESERDESLGEYVSTTRVPNAPSSVFPDISAADAASGITLYAILALVNPSASVAWPAVRGWIAEQPAADVAFAFGLDPAGIVDLEDTDPQGAEIADNETAPAGVTFAAPDERETGTLVGTVPPRSTILVPVRAIVSAGSTPDELAGFTLCFATCYPREAAPES